MQAHDKKNGSQQEYFLQNRLDGTERTFKEHQDPSHEGGVTLRNAQMEDGQEMLDKEGEQQVEDDEFRQQIEKETLDKILNQEIIEFDDELANMRGIGDGKGVQNIEIDPIVLNGLEQAEKNGRSANGSKPSQMGKPATPRYRKPTVETILKDVRSQRQQPLSKNFRRENPNFKYTRDQKAVDYAALPQSQMLNSFDSDLPAGGSPKAQPMKNPRTFMAKDARAAEPKTAKEPPSSHEQSKSVVILNSLGIYQQQSHGIGLKGAKTKPAGDKKKMYITLGQNQQNQFQEFTTTSHTHTHHVLAHANAQESDLDAFGKPRSPAKQSQPPLGAKENGFKTLHTERSCINFAMPQPKSLKKRQLDQPPRIQLASNSVTMYVGCIDPPEEDQEPQQQALSKTKPTGDARPSELTTYLRENREQTLEKKKKLDAVKQTDEYKYYEQMKQTRFEGIQRDIYDMSQMVDHMVSKAEKGPTLTESYHAMQRDILDVSQEKADKFRINKKLPVHYVDDNDAKKLNTSLQVQQFTNAFKVPKYSPAKFERLSKGQSTVTPRKESLQKQPHEVDEIKSSGMRFVRAVRATKIDDESNNTPRRESNMEPAAKNVVNLLNMQNQIKNMHAKMMTPTAQLRKLDFAHMDERQTIEHHRTLRNIQQTALWQKLKNGTQGSFSASPIARRSDFNFQSTNLKKLKTRNSVGNIDDNLSLTTKVLSGHNTPLSNMHKKEKYLNQINQEQDELLEKLKRKQRQLEFRSLKASHQFDSFVMNLPQAEQPDPRTHASLYDNIKRARESMFVHKMKPLQTTRSFDSWRSDIEKQIDGGLTFDVEMPRRFNKHLHLINQRRQKAADDAELLQARDRFESPEKMQGEAMETQHSRTSETFLRKQIIQKKQNLTRGQESQLRVLEIQLQEQQVDKEIEIQAQQFFNKVELEETNTRQHHKRKALLDRVRQRLRQKADRTERRQPQKEDASASPDHGTLLPLDDVSPEQDASNRSALQDDSITLLDKQRVHSYNRDRGGVAVLSPASPTAIRKQRNLKNQMQTQKLQELYGLEEAIQDQPKTIGSYGEQHILSHKQKASQRQEELEKNQDTLDVHEDPKYDENYGMNNSQGEMSVPYERVQMKSHLLINPGHHRRNLTRQNDQQKTLSPKVSQKDQFSSQNHMIGSTLSTKNKSNQYQKDHFGQEEISNSMEHTYNISNELFSRDTLTHTHARDRNAMANANVNTQLVSSESRVGNTGSESASVNKQFVSMKSSLNAKSGRNLTGMQTNLQTIQDEVVTRFKSRNDDEADSLEYITTIDAGQRIQQHQSLVDVQNQVREQRRMINMNKPKTAGAKRTVKDLRHGAGQGRSQQLVGNGHIANAQSQSTFPNANVMIQQAMAMHAYEQQRSSPGHESQERRMGQDRRASLLRENLAARKKMGYQTYQGLSKQQRLRVSSDVKKRQLAGKAPTRILSALPTSGDQPSSAMMAPKPALLESSKTNSMAQSQDRHPENTYLAVDLEVAAANEPSEASQYITGENGRTIKRFTAIERSSTIPHDLEHQFNTLAANLDEEAANQYDFLTHNKAVVSDPENIRMTAMGRHIHNYRRNPQSRNPKNYRHFYQTQMGFQNTTQRGHGCSEAIRQCDCHYARQKQEDQGFQGIINLRKRHLDGINSQVYNSLDATQNLRLKPRHCVQRTQTLTKYYRKGDNQAMQDDFETFLTRLDADEEATSSRQAAQEHLNFQKVLDPNRTEAMSAGLKGRSVGLTANGVCTQICKLIQACQAERQENRKEAASATSTYNIDRNEVHRIKDTYDKLDMTLAKYIDLEKIQQENTLTALKEAQSLMSIPGDYHAQNEQDNHTLAPASESLFSGRIDGADTARRFGSIQASTSRRQAAGLQSHRQPTSARHLTKLDTTHWQNQQPLLSLKDIYIDLMRNKKLDYENFYEPSVVAKCLEQKRDLTHKVAKYKTKIWKPNYSRIVQPPRGIPKEPLNRMGYQQQMMRLQQQERTHQYRGMVRRQDSQSWEQQLRS